MSVIDDVLNANEQYARTHELRHLSPRPRRRLAVLACMDTRLSNQTLGLAEGDAHIIRNAGGIVTTDFFGSDDEIRGIAVQPNGKLVVAGLTSNGTTQFSVARYNFSGTLDQSFGVSGVQFNYVNTVHLERNKDYNLPIPTTLDASQRPMFCIASCPAAQTQCPAVSLKQVDGHDPTPRDRIHK